MKCSYEIMTSLQYKVKSLTAALNSFQSGEKYVKMQKEHQTEVAYLMQRNKELSKEKQSRPRGKNGRATKCYIKRIDLTFFAPIHFDCQRDAVDWLINMEYIPSHNKEYIIKKLKSQDGYCGWKLTQF